MGVRGFRQFAPDGHIDPVVKPHLQPVQQVTKPVRIIGEPVTNFQAPVMIDLQNSEAEARHGLIQKHIEPIIRTGQTASSRPAPSVLSVADDGGNFC